MDVGDERSIGMLTLSPNGQKLYVADGNSLKEKLKIFDISDVDNPVLLSTIDIEMQGIVISKDNNKAYVSSNDNRVRIYDVSVGGINNRRCEW